MLVALQRRRRLEAQPGLPVCQLASFPLGLKAGYGLAEIVQANQCRDPAQHVRFAQSHRASRHPMRGRWLQPENDLGDGSDVQQMGQQSVPSRFSALGPDAANGWMQ